MRPIGLLLLLCACGASTHDEAPQRPVTERPIARSTVQPTEAPAPGASSSSTTPSGLDLRSHGLPVVVAVVAPLEIESARAPVDIGGSRSERNVVHLRSLDPDHVTQVRLFAASPEEGQRYVDDALTTPPGSRVVRAIDSQNQHGYVVSLSGSETDGPYEVRVYDSAAGVICDATAVLSSPSDRVDRAIEACLAIRPAEPIVVER